MKKSSCSYAVLALVLLGNTAAASSVQPPPLPPGSAKILLKPGQNTRETARSIHAHQRPKKDKQRNDTLPTTATVAAANPGAATGSSK